MTKHRSKQHPFTLRLTAVVDVARSGSWRTSMAATVTDGEQERGTPPLDAWRQNEDMGSWAVMIRNVEVWLASVAASYDHDELEYQLLRCEQLAFDWDGTN